jgi:hypothetical protein
VSADQYLYDEWRLHLDDEAFKISVPPCHKPIDDTWHVARSSGEALILVCAYGAPYEINFDFELGMRNGNLDTAMRFLHDWKRDRPKAILKVREYRIHSASQEEKRAIDDYMREWSRRARGK